MTESLQTKLLKLLMLIKNEAKTMEKHKLIDEIDIKFEDQMSHMGQSLFDLMWQLLINEKHEQPYCLYDVYHEDGYQLAIVKPDSQGYIPTACFIEEDFPNDNWDSAWDFIYQLNKKAFAHDEQTVWEMVASSMSIEAANHIEKIQKEHKEREDQIKLAEQQIVGFIHARRGDDLMSLIQSMGLKKEEWEALREENLGFLDYEKKQIDNYFKDDSVTGREAGSHG